MDEEHKYWLRVAAVRCPRAVAAGRVSGVGPFALLSCPADDGVRHVQLFKDAMDRNRALWKWDRNDQCGELNCNGDHRILDLKEEVEHATVKNLVNAATPL